MINSGTFYAFLDRNWHCRSFLHKKFIIKGVRTDVRIVNVIGVVGDLKQEAIGSSKLSASCWHLLRLLPIAFLKGASIFVNFKLCE